MSGFLDRMVMRALGTAAVVHRRHEPLFTALAPRPAAVPLAGAPATWPASFEEDARESPERSPDGVAAARKPVSRTPRATPAHAAGADADAALNVPFALADAEWSSLGSTVDATASSRLEKRDAAASVKRADTPPVLDSCGDASHERSAAVDLGSADTSGSDTSVEPESRRRLVRPSAFAAPGRAAVSVAVRSAATIDAAYDASGSANEPDVRSGAGHSTDVRAARAQCDGDARRIGNRAADEELTINVSIGRIDVARPARAAAAAVPGRPQQALSDYMKLRANVRGR